MHEEFKISYLVPYISRALFSIQHKQNRLLVPL